MVHKAIHTERISEGLDRQNLTQLQKRFLQINQVRLERTRSSLSERQRIFLDAIPLLLHVNHPMLPGYVSHNTPSGVCGYKPEKQDLATARALARSFHLQADPSRDCEIEGIYLMGSVGTVGHSDRSDLDIWVCVRSGMDHPRLAELNRKCQRIAEWASGLRLEAHFFPMDSKAFQEGQLSPLNAESSGSAQRLLLLDEFYRTAVHLAGRLPLWWFVPAAAEADYPDYANTLLHRRYLPADTVLDFGGVAAIPDTEFLGAGVWQLYKAIGSPYKSALKLLLLEAYADQHPCIQPLSLSYKQRVYEGQLDVDELDSYVMIYRRIEAHLLKQQQWQRLELVRRCLYFKINKPLSRPPAAGRKSWQRQLLEHLVAEWGWSRDTIRLLDQRSRWKTQRVLEERAQLVNELNHSYRFLMDFANRSGCARAISAEELTILGRKLQAAFERRPGKVEWINPGISEDLSEPLLVLRQTASENGDIWTAATPPPDVSLAAAASPIKQCGGLVELLLWCQYNGLIQKGTRFDLSGTAISEDLLRRLLASLQRWLPKSAASRVHKAFEKPAAPSHVLLLLNVNAEPQAQLREQGMQRTSNRMDALRYSGFDHNLVVSVDVVLRNSWQEITCTRLEGEQALLAALEEYLRLTLPDSRQTPPQLTIRCIGSSHGAIITQRVREWFADIIACYYHAESAPRDRRSATRYLFAMANRYYSLQFRGPRLQIDSHRSEAALLRWLGHEQPGYSAFVIDQRAALRHPLRLIAAHAEPHAISVFYYPTRQGLQLYLVDEMGSLVNFSSRGLKEQMLITLHRFLRAVVQRHARSSQAFAAAPSIRFFEFCKNGDLQLICRDRQIAVNAAPGRLIDLKCAVTADGQNNYRYSFYCEQQEFSYLEHGENVFHVTADYVRRQRQPGESYPVYLSDLDLDMSRQQLAKEGRLQTSHYLRLKLEIEQALNLGSFD